MPGSTSLQFSLHFPTFTQGYRPNAPCVDAVKEKVCPHSSQGGQFCESISVSFLLLGVGFPTSGGEVSNSGLRFSILTEILLGGLFVGFVRSRVGPCH